MPYRHFNHNNNNNNNHHHHHFNRNPNRGGGPNHHHQHHHQFNGLPPPQNHSFGGRDGSRPMDDSGGKRPFPFSGRGDNTDNGGYTKLFVAYVPWRATEDDIRPLFEEHGNVVEVVFIKDKKTGEQQGCCFVKYASSEEADRAIKALDNQYILPGGLGPIEVRYADVERERPPATEMKLYVAELNKQATEKEIEEIFSPYGRVEDIFILLDEMKQSRGIAFVQFSHRDMAVAAINALHGTYVMTGCHMPLKVKFAAPKRPKGGESRSDTAFRGSAFGPRLHTSLGVRLESNQSDRTSGHIQPNAWRKTSPHSSSPSSQAHEFTCHSVAKTVAAPDATTTSTRTPTAPTTVTTSTTFSIPSHTRASIHTTCEWSEHTCPDGFNYYYNCITKESRWEEPEELTCFKQQQQNLSVQNVEVQSKTQNSATSTAFVYQSHSTTAGSTSSKTPDQQQLQPQPIST